LPCQLAYSGLLLPWLMQLRVRPALVVHGWRVAALNVPFSLTCAPLSVAVRDALLLLACAMAVSVVSDIWCRRRWLMVRGGGAVQGSSAASGSGGSGSGKAKGV
jgi:hypothetical protein